MEITLLPNAEGNVIAHGSYIGGPDHEFVVGDDEQVYFHVVGDRDVVWAGPDVESFRRIVAAWQRYQVEGRELSSESARFKLVDRMRQELVQLGALPGDLPPDPEPLWSLLLFEAEHDLG
jgi:hypothetical protein